MLFLWPHNAPGYIYLSSFQRFSELQELNLGVSLNPDYEYEDEYTNFFDIIKYGEYDSMYNPDTYDVLLDSPFNTLHSLSLHGCFGSVMDPRRNLSTLFSVLTKLTTNVKGNRQGKLMADQMMSLSTLSNLGICVLDANSCSWQPVLPKDGHVQQLTVGRPCIPTTSRVCGHHKAWHSA